MSVRIAIQRMLAETFESHAGATDVSPEDVYDELDQGTLRETADEAGAKDFDAFCDELENWL